MHCVIVGFGLGNVAEKTIFEYENIKGEAHAVKVSNINPYLVDAPDVIAQSRMTPLSAAPAIANGSIPADRGNLILEPEERDQLLAAEPQAAPWIRPYLGAGGFINGNIRYCLWLVDCPPQTLRAMPLVRSRVNGVRRMREASAKAATRLKANTPTLFTENRQPTSGRYLAFARAHRRKTAAISRLATSIIPSSLPTICNSFPMRRSITSGLSAVQCTWLGLELHRAV